MNETLLCKDCKHSFRQWSEWWVPQRVALRCRLAFVPKQTKVAPVTGPNVDPAHYETCAMSRNDWLSKKDNCGPQGRFWEPKHKKGLFKLIAKTQY